MQHAETIAAGETSPVPFDLVQTIEAIDEEDLVSVNDDTRTWNVTDVVDREIEGADPRLSKRAIRMENYRGRETDVFALVLEEYPDSYGAGFHVLETTDWYEEERVYDVESVEILETLIPWVVVRNSSSSQTYHFPDPFSAASGEAVPACGGQPGEEIVEGDYRIARVNAVYPAKRPCMDCARRHHPREIPKLNCPECGYGIGRGLFHGKGLRAIGGVYIECAGRDCDFEGVVSLGE
jgi:hypothetical protein